MKAHALSFVLLCTLAACTRATSVDLQSSTNPLLLWSNRAIVGKGSGSQVLYKVLADVEEAAGKAVLSVLGKHGEATELVHAKGDATSSQRTAIVIFAGSQLGAADLRKGTAARLSAVLDAASSSLVCPFTSGQTDSMALYRTLKKAGLNVQAVGCSEPSDDVVRDVTSALAAAEVQVLVVCPKHDASLSHTQAGLEQELEQLLAVQEAVDAAEVNHLFMYTSQKNEARHLRRVLAADTPATQATAPLTGFGPYTTCGTLCQTQVRWLEALLSVLFLALASCAGLTCLNVLNTPTRYEVSKEGQ